MKLIRHVAEGRAPRTALPELPGRPMLAERARSRPSGQSRTRPRIAEDSRGAVRPDGYVRVRSSASSQLSAAQWRRWFVLAPPAAAVVSERWAGPTVGPSVARIPRVSLSLSLLSRTLSFSLCLSLSLFLSRPYTRSSPPRARHPRQVSTTAFRKRKQRKPTRRASVDVTRQPTRSESGGRKERRRKKKTPRLIAAIALDRGRPIVLTNLPTPPVQERRTAAATKENYEGSALESDRLITHEDLSPSKDPAQRHCETTLRGSPKAQVIFLNTS